MIFSSITFLYYFLPCVLLLYWLVPKKGKNIILLFSSMFFYAWGEPKYVILMAVSILISYVFGILIEKTRENEMSKWFCLCSVMISLLLLGYFKYVDFFIDNVNGITGANIPLQNVVLPIGISFYTFQSFSGLCFKVIYRFAISECSNKIRISDLINHQFIRNSTHPLFCQ